MPDDKNQPGTPVQPDEGVQPVQSTQELAIPGRPVGEILKDANDLMKKIEEAEAARKAHVQELYNKHGYVAQTHKNLLANIEEAEKNLAYFEQAEKSGLLTGDDLEKYKQLKEDLEKVKKTRDEMGAKMIAIFNQPGVGDKIHEDALNDNEGIDLGKEGVKLFDEEIPKAILGILEDAGSYIQTLDEARKEYEEASADVDKKIAGLEKSVPKMDKTFSRKIGYTAHDLYLSFRDRHYDLALFRKNLSNGAAQLGYFRRKERKAVEEFVNSEEVIALAKAMKVKEQKGEKYTQVQDEWRDKQQRIAKKFEVEVIAKIEERNTKEKIFQQKTGDRHAGAAVGYSRELQGLANEALRKYLAKEERPAGREFTGKLGQFLSVLKSAHGNNLFYFA